MAEVIAFEPGGYEYIKGVFQYSAGVAALPGFAIERARLRTPLPILEGFALVEQHLATIGRPMTAFCACELRSPAPFSDQGFSDFNRQYVQTLERWGIFENETNPVARTNVCPIYETPTEPVLHAFSYTVPSDSTQRSFIIAGGGEAREGTGRYQENIIRLGDLSPDAMREKVQFVMAAMEGRLQALGFTWRDANTAQVYTIHDVGYLLGEEVVAKCGPIGGIVLNLSRPPVVNIEYEMDVRGAAREIVI